MTTTKQVSLFAGLSAAALCVGALVAAKNTGEKSSVQTSAPVQRNQPVNSFPRVELTSLEKQVFNEMDATGQKTVTAFLTQTPGPLDNYLLKLEGMVEVANAPYGEPDKASWERALPVAKILEQGMCDCAQRNWLNQFIVLGEVGLTGDRDQYHQQGKVMASIMRYDGDKIVSQ